MTDEAIDTKLEAAHPHLRDALDATEALGLLGEARDLLLGTGIKTPMLNEVIDITTRNIGRSLAKAAVAFHPGVKVA